MSLVAGVLGGMGPAATADFFARVVAAGAGGRDQDHIRLIIDNNPFVPDRNAAAAGDGPSPGGVLAGMARGLERAGADFLVMPCNAAHAYAAEIRAATRLPFIDMIEAAVDVTVRMGVGGQVGVLAADACLQARLYQDALAARGLEAVVLDEAAQARFMALLYRIKAGELGPAAQGEMAALAAELVGQGAQAIVAGCTEVPLVLDAAAVSVPLPSSTDALVQATLARARGGIATR